jgi:hypothetical protein
MPTISPFGIDGNKGTWTLFSPFDINVKEHTLPLSSCSIFRRYQILIQHKIPLTGWTLLFEACKIFVSNQSLLLLILGPIHLHLSAVSSVEYSILFTSLTGTPSSTFSCHNWITPPIIVLSASDYFPPLFLKG